MVQLVREDKSFGRPSVAVDELMVLVYIWWAVVQLV